MENTSASGKAEQAQKEKGMQEAGSTDGRVKVRTIRRKI